MKKVFTTLLIVLTALCLMTGCQQSVPQQEIPESTAQRDVLTPALPESLVLDDDGVPIITVYNVSAEDYETLDVEDYVAGVLAGEMRNDWPMEALKAQAILARTYTLKFISEKTSQYKGADISTDIAEAQAYDAAQINDRVRRAVDETRGMVLSYRGELPYAWFHAHSGGMTELPVEGLAYDKDNPPYTQRVDSPDSESAPTSSKQWTASFSTSEVAKAAQAAGADVGETVSSIEAGDRSESNRVLFFLINGSKVNAANLRLNLDSKKLKSTLIDSVSLSGDRITFIGRGYGHGVGMSQWGAYGMAEEGKKAEDIVSYYFKDVDIVAMWP